MENVPPVDVCPVFPLPPVGEKAKIMAEAIVFPLPSFKIPAIVLSAVEMLKVLEVAESPSTREEQALGHPETTTSTGLGIAQFGDGGGPENPPPPPPLGIAGPIPIFHVPFEAGIAITARV